MFPETQRAENGGLDPSLDLAFLGAIGGSVRELRTTKGPGEASQCHEAKIAMRQFCCSSVARLPSRRGGREKRPLLWGERQFVGADYWKGDAMEHLSVKTKAFQ